MDLQLKDKVVIVTGGAEGIAAAIVRVCAAEGAIPAIVDRDGAAGEKLQSELKTLGVACGVITLELETAEHCSPAFGP
jgi:L-fucose dehydrogenase